MSVDDLICLVCAHGKKRGCCQGDCDNVRQAYQRGRDEERAKALSGANAYLKQAITEATEQAYAMGRDWSRVNERNRIADALVVWAGKVEPDVEATLMEVAERLRKGEV